MILFIVHAIFIVCFCADYVKLEQKNINSENISVSIENSDGADYYQIYQLADQIASIIDHLRSIYSDDSEVRVQYVDKPVFTASPVFVGCLFNRPPPTIIAFQS